MVALQREVPETAGSVSPDAIPPRLRRRGGTPRQVLAMILAGTLVLALLASRDLPGWTERLGDLPGAAAFRTAAGSWDRAMEILRLTLPHEALRGAIRRALDWRW